MKPALRALCFSAIALVSCHRQRSDVAPPRETPPTKDPRVEQVIQIGDATLAVPAQAKGKVPSLQAEVHASGIVGVSRVYRFGPDGTTFDPPATITIALDGEEQAFSLASAVVALHQADGSWQPLEDSRVDAARRRVTAKVHHFSEYAVVSTSPVVYGTGTRFQAGSFELTSQQVMSATMLATSGLVHLTLAYATPQNLTVAGLAPGANYFIYTGSYANSPEIIQTNALGVLDFHFTGAAPTEMMIQPRHGTIILPFGCWLAGGVSGQNSCTLTASIADDIEIAADAPPNYMLDCAGNGIYGTGSGIGVRLSGNGASVTNCVVRGFAEGVEIPYDLANVNQDTVRTVSGVDISDCAVGIYATNEANLKVVSSRTHQIYRADSSFVSSPAVIIPLPFPLPPIESRLTIAKNFELYGNAFEGDIIFNAAMINTAVGGGPDRLGNQARKLHFSSQISDVSRQVSVALNQLLSFSMESSSGPHTDIAIQGNEFSNPLLMASTGIDLGECQNCTISANSVLGYSTGMRAWALLSGAVTGNLFSGNDAGMILDDWGFATSDLAPLIQENRVEYGSTGIQLYGSASTLSGNTITHMSLGLQLLLGHSTSQPGTPRIYLNDIYLNSTNIVGDYPIDLGQSGAWPGVGNFWGHGCDQGTYFVLGVDTPAASPVNDSNAWGVSVLSPGSVPLSVLLAGGPPGCQTIGCYQSTPTTVLLLRR